MQSQVPRFTQEKTDEHYAFHHQHSVQFCRPTGAAAVTITGGAGAWNLGAYAELVAVNNITEPFDIHWGILHNPSANVQYEIVLYAATTEIARLRFQRVNAVLSSILCPVMTPILAANTQIQAKIMDDTGGATADLVILGHTYPND